MLNKSDIEQIEIIQTLFSYISFSMPNSFIAQAESKQDLINLDSISSNSILFSDTILIWTVNTDYKSLLEFIYRIQRLLRNAFMGGFPLRGTIEFDAIYHKPHIIHTKSSYNHYDLIVGPALMNAYKMEQNFEWMGCTLSNVCVAEIQKVIVQNGFSNVEDNEIFKNNILIKYEPPKKVGDVEELFVINWVDFIVRGIFKNNQIESLFIKDIKHPLMSWSEKRKIDNTNNFINYVSENGFSNIPIGTYSF